MNGVLRGSTEAKTLGACGPSGFGLGTSLGTPFTTLHPRLFHIMSQSTYALQYTMMYFNSLHHILMEPQTFFLPLLGSDPNFIHSATTKPQSFYRHNQAPILILPQSSPNSHIAHFPIFIPNILRIVVKIIVHKQRSARRDCDRYNT